MKFNDNDLVRQRVLALVPLFRSQLERNYTISEDAESAFKWCYLVLNGPKKFLQQFKVGNLMISISEVHDFFSDNYDLLDGPSGLLDEEIDLIHRHNRESKNYLEQEMRSRRKFEFDHSCL